MNDNFQKLGYQVLGCRYVDGKKIIETDSGQFLVQPKNSNKEEVYEYLEKRDFPFFLPLINSYRDSYEIYPYVTDSISKEDKAIDLMHLLSLLHTKTTSYQDVVLDQVKETYEDIIQRLEYLELYYRNLQDYIESKVYMAPEESFLIQHMSLIYEQLYFGKKFIEEWYQFKSKAKRERIVFLHNNLSLANFIDKKSPMLINWDSAKKGYPVYDFYSFYKNHYIELEMVSLFQSYQSKFQFSNDELRLFYSLLCLIWKIEFKENHYDNTIRVRELVLYIQKSRLLFLKQQQENQEADN